MDAYELLATLNNVFQEIQIIHEVWNTLLVHNDIIIIQNSEYKSITKQNSKHSYTLYVALNFMHGWLVQL